MRTTLALFAFVFLAACGGGGGGSNEAAAPTTNEACDLIQDAAAIFGADPAVAAVPGDAPIGAVCQFTSADGVRSGEVLIFTPQSLSAVTAEAQMTELSTAWGEQTETALAPVDGLAADASALAKDLPGYQTQIVFRSGGVVVAVLGSSGDEANSGEQIARALATAALARLQANAAAPATP